MNASGPSPARPSSWRGDPAGIASRGVAFTIDAMVIMLMVSIGVYAADALLLVLGFDDRILTETFESPLGFAVILLVVTFVYFTLGFWLFGQTVGKLVMGLRVVRSDGSRPRFIQSVVRTLAYALSTFLMLGFLVVAISRQRRAWHDRIAHTWVVYDWEAHPRIAAIDDGEPLTPHRLP